MCLCLNYSLVRVTQHATDQNTDVTVRSVGGCAVQGVLRRERKLPSIVNMSVHCCAIWHIHSFLFIPNLL